MTNEEKAVQFAGLKHHRSSYAWNIAYESYLAALITGQNFCKPNVSGRAFVNIYSDSNGRFISTDNYETFEDAYASRDSLNTYVETVEIVSKQGV